MNLIDSSAWLEHFAAGPQAHRVAAAIENLERLLFPTIVLIEVAHRVKQRRDEDAALRCDHLHTESRFQRLARREVLLQIEVARAG